jgi:hypothetical protein
MFHFCYCLVVEVIHCFNCYSFYILLLLKKLKFFDCIKIQWNIIHYDNILLKINEYIKEKKWGKRIYSTKIILYLFNHNHVDILNFFIINCPHSAIDNQ